MLFEMCSNKTLAAGLNLKNIKSSQHYVGGTIISDFYSLELTKIFHWSRSKMFNLPFLPSVLVDQPLHQDQEDLEDPVDDRKSKVGATWELSS